MNSAMKTALTIVLLVAAVFGITVISQLSPNNPTPPGSGSVVTAPQALAIGFTDYLFDPHAEPENYHHRLFNGFFEVGSGGTNTSRNWVGFTLRNLRSAPTILAPLPPSCGKCTSARAAALPDPAVQAFAAQAAAGQFLAISGVPNPLAAIAWAEQVAPLNWFVFDFADLERRFEMPPAPTWCLLELDFKVTHVGPPTPVKAFFDVLDAKNDKLKPTAQEFVVTYAGREPLEIWPRDVNVGELAEAAEPRTVELYAFSMTRSHLDEPISQVNGNDPLVSVSPPRALTPAECDQLAVRLSTELKGAVRVLSGYRYLVTIRRDAPGQPADVGDFEKGIQFAAAGQTQRTQPITLKGIVTGAVRLDGATKIELGRYDAARPFRKEIRLVSERTNFDLELVPEQCKPGFLRVSLGEPVVEFGRKSWPLTIAIDEQQGRRLFTDGVIVLKSKGPNPTRFRFAVTGHGY